MVDANSAGLVIAATNALIRLKNPYLDPSATENCWEAKQLEDELKKNIR